MKIAILADPLDNQSAGIHTYTRELISALIRTAHHHEIILIRSQEKNDFHEVKNIIISSTRIPLVYQSFRLFFLIPLILRKEKVDIVFEPAHFGPFNLPPSIKRVTMIHDLTPILFPELHRYHSQLLQKIFLKRILKKADLILANSENTKNDIHQVYPFSKGKTKKILLGKDEDFSSYQNTEFLKENNLEEQNYILSVGTIEPRKKLTVLLEAFEMIKATEKSALKLVVVGQKGWKSAAFFEKLEEHPFKNDIILTGFITKMELRSLYTHAFVFVYPSMYEGFGLPILEALSCKTPVIAANNSSLPEVGGNAALYFETNNAQDLKNKIQQLMDVPELRASLISKSIAQAAKFSWEKYAKEFLEIIEERFGGEQ